MDMLILFPLGAGVATLVAVLASGAFLVRTAAPARGRRREPKHALR
jgi:hypothetical protein